MSFGSEPRGRGLQVTIKYGKGYEETWVSFSGLKQEIWDDIIDYFGLDRSAVEGLTLSELVVSATNLAHASGNVASYLGGVAIPPAQQGKPQESADDVWEQAGRAAQAKQADPAEPEKDPLISVIELAGSVDELKRIWAENQATFAEKPELLAQWKAKGKALSGK